MADRVLLSFLLAISYLPFSPSFFDRRRVEQQSPGHRSRDGHVLDRSWLTNRARDPWISGLYRSDTATTLFDGGISRRRTDILAARLLGRLSGGDENGYDATFDGSRL